MEHAKLAPSSAARRVACPGSRALEEQYPEITPSLSSREGTAAHWVAQEYLMHGQCAATVAPNGEPITTEMHEGAGLYEHEIKWKLQDVQLHIEEKINISVIHPECWGTADCWGMVGTHLYVFDYKFGHGYVDAFENWQLLEYAAGISSQVMPQKITLTVIQPRCFTKEGPIRSWTITQDELREYTFQLRECEALAALDTAVQIPSLECGNCRGRHACKTLQSTIMRTVDYIKDYGSYELDAQQTSRELKHLRYAAALLDARLTGIEEQAKSMLMRGEYLPGFKLEPSQGREHWTKDAQEILMMGELMGLDLAKPQETITPVQARKLGIHEDILKQYSQRVSGKLKLVEEINARKVFKK